MRALVIAAALASLLGAGLAHAITFAPGKKPDPFAPGKECDAPKLSSYGDYVHQWSSKYDLIFSPRDYPMWIWRCEASGYASFPADFAKISDTERPKIAAYLAKANFGPRLKAGDLSPEVLQHLEQLYALRDKDEMFRVYFLRYLAWQYRAKPIADEYRRKALDLYVGMVDRLTGNDLLEALYILGFYSYKFGRVDDAKKYFERLKTVETVDPETKKTYRGAPYLEGLAKEVLDGKADDKVRFANETN